ALLDLIGLDRVDACETPVELLVVHDVDDIGVEDIVDDQEVEWIEIVVVPEHLADCAQHIGQRMPRDGANEIVGFAHEGRANMSVDQATIGDAAASAYPKWVSIGLQIDPT